MTVLLIHTGGTIAMGHTPQGLTPVDGLVEEAVRQRLAQGEELKTHVFRPLLDSSDVGPSHWNEMLDVIDAEPDADVLLTHGTDTMAYTGAALSLALTGLGRRVVMCGSMVPLHMDGDAEANLDLAISALRNAGEGVKLAFSGELLQADGLVKHESHAANSFRSIPQDPLERPKVRRFDQRKLGVLTLSPGMPADLLTTSLSVLDGAVLRVFGSGTAMSDPSVLEALSRAAEAGKRIRAVSQCETGGLAPGGYAAGAGLWATGVENGGKQTVEAALIDLWLN
ncbi:asparaginase domain-containing protein [Roseibium suaedae]|uniref:L-asparaginase n=1 Tax=Roseibium suaedae TaxID=735517 RepID=A0A1M7I551_9HYPH|nr:asparaginase domain-containing protein [Roseibium suaedae]SHM35788.1 L-asparaginase [Roseibium suaedae]